LTPAPLFLRLRGDGSPFKPELQEKVERVAAENRSDADEYVQQLVENYLDHDAWFRQKVTASLGKLDRGEF
jgi:predicted transcriptional regulator